MGITELMQIRRFLPRFHWVGLRTVFLGTVAAKLFPAVGALMIARLFFPSAYGEYVTWLGIVSLVSVVITGRYEVSLATEEDGKPRVVGVVATLLVVIVGALFLLIFSLIFSKFLQEKYSIDAFLILTIAPASALTAALQVWQHWAAGDGRYSDLSWIRVSLAVGITGFQVLIGYFYPNSVSLVIAHLVGLIVGLGVSIYRSPIKQLDSSRREILNFLSRQKRLPKISLWASLLSTLSSQIPIILASNRFGTEVAGLLAMAVKVMGVPMGLLGASVLDVFRRSASIAYREKGNCRTEYVHTASLLLVFAISTTLFILIFGKNIFQLGFSATWDGASEMMFSLVPMFTMRLIASPLSYVVYIANKQIIDLYWQIALCIFTITVWTLCSSYGVSILIYSIGYASLYLIYIQLTYKISKGKS